MIKKENLKKRYSRKNNQELIEIVENPKDYVPLALEVAFELIQERNIPKEALERMATQLMEAKLVDFVRNLDWTGDTVLELPHSEILDRNIVKRLFSEEFTRFRKNREAMNYGLDTYYGDLSEIIKKGTLIK